MKSTPIYSIKSRMQGFTLIELLGVLTLISFGLVSASYWASRSLDEHQGELTSNYVREFNLAATRFVNAQFSDGTNGFFSGGANAVAVGAARAFNGGNLGAFLAAGFGAQNPLGQTPCLVVRRTAANAVEAYTVMARPAGAAMPLPLELTNIATSAGPNTGFFGPGPANFPNANEAAALSGAWRENAGPIAIAAATPAGCGTAPLAGDLVSKLTLKGVGMAPGMGGSSYLYRERVPGFPELNQMRTTLDMTGNDIRNVGTLFAQYANIDISAFIRRLDAWYTYTWDADVYRNLTVGGQIPGTPGQVTINGNATINGLATIQDANIRNRITTWDATVNNQATVNILNITGTSREGTACAPEGQVVRDWATGNLLICRGGVFFASGTPTIQGPFQFLGTSVTPILWCSGGRRAINLTGICTTQQTNDYYNMDPITFHSSTSAPRRGPSLAVQIYGDGSARGYCPEPINLVQTYTLANRRAAPSSDPAVSPVDASEAWNRMWYNEQWYVRQRLETSSIEAVQLVCL